MSFVIQVVVSLPPCPCGLVQIGLMETLFRPAAGFPPRLSHAEIISSGHGNVGPECRRCKLGCSDCASCLVYMVTIVSN